VGVVGEGGETVDFEVRICIASSTPLLSPKSLRKVPWLWSSNNTHHTPQVHSLREEAV
jgi:hypothetical protein